MLFKTIIVPLHRGRFVVVHLYSSFSMDPMIFPGKFIPKTTIFANLGAVSPHFQSCKLPNLCRRAASHSCTPSKRNTAISSLCDEMYVCMYVFMCVCYSDNILC